MISDSSNSSDIFKKTNVFKDETKKGINKVRVYEELRLELDWRKQ